MLAEPPVVERPTPRSHLARHAGWLIALVVSVAVGRATVIDGESLSLIWPAAGVAVCWVLASRGPARGWVVLLIGVTVAAGNGLTGSSSGLVLGLVAANLTQTLIAAHGLEHWLGHVRGCGGDELLVRVTDVVRILAVVLAACLPAAVVGVVTLDLVGTPVGLTTLITWLGRNAVGMLCVVAMWLLVLRPRAATGRSRREALVAACFGSRRERLPLRVLELVVLLALTVAPWVGFGSDGGAEDVLFVLLVLMVWAGLRLAPPAVVAYGLVSGLVGVAFAMVGPHAISATADPMVVAVHVQVFVAVTALTGVALAFSRAERDAVVAELASRAARQEAEATTMARILATVEDGLVVVENDGTIMLANRAARRLLDQGERPAIAGLPYAPALRGRTVPPRDIVLPGRAAGPGRVLAVGARPLPGEPVRALIHLRDVTAERHQHEALSSFAGVVAHDLLNPLALVQGWAETVAVELEDGPLDPAVGSPMIERIQTGAQRMRVLIDDLLGYTLARDAQVRPQAVDITALVREIAVLREAGPRRPLVRVEPGLAAWADQVLVRQLLDNLIGNGIKYTDPMLRPVIEISGRQREGWVELRITDNGVGIPPEKREAVFAAFERGGTSMSSGTGLGLAICQQIVERHHGTIRAEAGPHGTGTTIVVRLPRTPVAQESSHADRRKDLPMPSRRERAPVPGRPR